MTIRGLLLALLVAGALASSSCGGDSNSVPDASTDTDTDTDTDTSADAGADGGAEPVCTWVELFPGNGDGGTVGGAFMALVERADGNLAAVSQLGELVLQGGSGFAVAAAAPSGFGALDAVEDADGSLLIGGFEWTGGPWEESFPLEVIESRPRLLRFDGTTLEEIGLGAVPCNAIIGLWADGGRALALCENGDVLRREGDGWRSLSPQLPYEILSGTSPKFYGIWGDAPTDVFLFGEIPPAVGLDPTFGIVVRYDGSAWRHIGPSSCVSPESVWRAGVAGVLALAADVSAVYSTDLVVMRFDGADWTKIATLEGDEGSMGPWFHANTTKPLVVGTESYVATRYGIFRGDASEWGPLPDSPPGEELRHVARGADGDMYVTADSGKIYRRICEGGPSAGTNTDADTDSDSDTDTDSDSDTDTDADTDADPCVVADPFHPEECPETDPIEPLIRFVDGTAISPGDGSSWATALASPQPAIDSCRCAAIALGAPCQVWVAAGTYATDPANPCDTFWLRPNVAVYGGFAGDEASLAARDWIANATTLDGGGAYRVVHGATGATLDGFTITGGGSATAYLNGGGMYNNAASPAVANCTFDGNWGGRGGGMYNVHAAPTVTACAFTGNRAYDGGGVANSLSTPEFSGCVFANNDATHEGGGLYDGGYSSRMDGCAFVGNTASGGGAIAYGGGGPWFAMPLIATGCTFADNAANAGGAAWFDFSSAELFGCSFSRNTAVEEGGAVRLHQAGMRATDCAFDGNAAASGGAVYAQYSTTALSGCTFARNNADLGGGGLYHASSESNSAVNCIWWGSSIYTPPAYDDPPTITFSDVEGGCTVAAECTTDDTGNIDADPLFVNGDPDAGAVDLRLQAASPCIDTGSNDAVPDGGVTDLDGNPRIVGAAVDMGAYEFQP